MFYNTPNFVFQNINFFNAIYLHISLIILQLTGTTHTEPSPFAIRCRRSLPSKLPRSNYPKIPNRSEDRFLIRLSLCYIIKYNGVYRINALAGPPISEKGGSPVRFPTTTIRVVGGLTLSDDRSC